MAYKEFFEGKVLNVFDDGDTIELAQFKPTNNSELAHIRADLLIHGNLSGGERMRCKIGLTSDDTAPYATSDWVTLTDTDDSDGSNDWLTWLRFDFDRENINKNQTYFVWLEIDSYTRVADTFYVAVSFDWPTPTYGDKLIHTTSTWAFQWFAYFE